MDLRHSPFTAYLVRMAYYEEKRADWGANVPFRTTGSSFYTDATFSWLEEEGRSGERELILFKYDFGLCTMYVNPVRLVENIFVFGLIYAFILF